MQENLIYLCSLFIGKFTLAQNDDYLYIDSRWQIDNIRQYYDS